MLVSETGSLTGTGKLLAKRGWPASSRAPPVYDPPELGWQWQHPPAVII